MNVSLALIAIFTALMKADSLKLCKTHAAGCPEDICNKINSRDSNYCRDAKCEVLTSMDCPNGTSFESGIQMCGCCPGCSKYKDVGETCNTTQLNLPIFNATCITGSNCAILKNWCKPGLVCEITHNDIGVCAQVKSSKQQSLIRAGSTETCEFKRNLGLTGALHWIPECDPDGTYAPKQCKGTAENGICFCVDSNGQRIFGTQWRNKAENQTCECSRKMKMLRTEGHLSTTHCSHDGNFEGLQCDVDVGLCYCVDPYKGTISGSIVPQHRWQLLPCYNSSKRIGMDSADTYLTRCEQEWITNKKERQVALMYGFDVIEAVNFTCEYDGSFSPVRKFGDQSYCVTLKGQILANSGYAHNNYTANLSINCRCFRDSLMHEQAGIPFTKRCSPRTGNYEPVSLANPTKKKYQCVDQDGFFFGDVVPKKYKCCLLGTCDAEKQILCSSTKEVFTYRQCSLVIA